MRKNAAAVPASKAQIGTVYAAIRKGDLTRFRVTRITTHRVDNTGSPHDYESEITGDFILEGVGLTQKLERATIQPSQLLGRFEEYEVLVKQQAHEKALGDAKTAAEKKVAADLVTMLYDISGLPIPNDRYARVPKFEVDYSHGVEINKDAAKVLLEKLQEAFGNVSSKRAAALRKQEKEMLKD